MTRDIGRMRVLLSAGFGLAVLALAGFGLFQVAGRRWRAQPTFHVRASFDTVSGLEAGHRVRLQGIDAGIVERVVAPSQPGGKVELVMRIDERLRTLVRVDTVVRIASEGLVGAKVVELAPGSPDAAVAGELDMIGSEPPTEMNDLLKKAAASLARLDAATVAAEAGLGEINAIAASIRRGEGSLGKLVHDDELHRRLLDLSHQSERTLTSLDENLAALKETWPLSRYFERRQYLDRDRVLFQPGATRNSRVLSAEDLFEAGRSVLTPVGQTRLDEIGRWCKHAGRPSSQVVIAAFTDENRNQDLAEALTQEQAESVRQYLVSKHNIQSAGWFKTRKVAAVGFGAHAPPSLEPAGEPALARRIEIIVFTPQV